MEAVEYPIRVIQSIVGIDKIVRVRCHPDQVAQCEYSIGEPELQMILLVPIDVIEPDARGVRPVSPTRLELIFRYFELFIRDYASVLGQVTEALPVKFLCFLFELIEGARVVRDDPREHWVLPKVVEASPAELVQQ